eukprot:TRINITY_DN250_c0_g1_i2.p1 TRINITY_DN250_c0_g1~~TRINITY_DN250_c0_g1_i2.p1  ORF type:complete len:293 (-),score=45.13 TRINITY_DN250_c0_g1_i2:127-1005(-)
MNVPVIPYEDIQILETIGNGGFADIFKALYRGQPVAVKRWRVQDFAADQLQLFQREVQIGSSVRHANCVTLYAVTLQPFALVMEYVDGLDLYDLIHNPSNTLTWAMIRQMAIDMALGIQHLHSRAVIHRDLKSPNFIVDRHTLQVKVCDFGLSRVKETTVKMTGGRGTVHWMAPEVINHFDYTESADVYSYGMCLWELVSRDLPFYDIFHNQSAVAEAVALKHRRPDIPATCPPLISQLITQCWAENPMNRPTLDQVLRCWQHPMMVPPELENVAVVSSLVAGAAPASSTIL